MHRTTLALKDDLYQRLDSLALQSNRSTPNLIETILIRHLEEEFYVDAFEMDALQRDKSLKKSITRGLSDYKAGRGKFV